ncbi:MAG: alkaline phosphatase family protein [Candidatus Hydrogenedentes bacterium]|nr:alkaline phosphatase family protein [Candidatus Hydrogenedentota bacterium]
MSQSQVKRVLLIGLDCAAPQFVFGPGAFDLPNLHALQRRGGWGLLTSCHPPITVPAWACMMSGKDPGTLGCYGFRNRADYSYEALATHDATHIVEPRVWDILSRHGKKSVVLGMPQTYPPRPLEGCLVSDFLTPDASCDYTYPKSLKQEIEARVGEYLFDVKDFRTEEKAGLLKRIYALTENRFKVARHLLQTKEWDFFAMVEMGPDRLHHGFWRFCDSKHPKYVAGNPFEHAFRDYYQFLDTQIGELLSLVDESTAVLVVSDHGAQAMRGGVCINQWLMDHGYLKLKTPVHTPTPIEQCDIDWDSTRAWAAGGYYARLMINVKGREAKGIVPLNEYEALRTELKDKLEIMAGPDGQPLGTRVCRPEDLYKSVKGIPPDLFVYFGDLAWRAIGTVAHDSVFSTENDTGPDDANHDYHGLLIMDDGGERAGRLIRGKSILNVAPTVLSLLNVPIPGDFQAGPIE